MERNEIRDYELMNKLHELFESLSDKERIGAYDTIYVIASHLVYKYFEEKQEIDIKALVKTFEEVYERSIESQKLEFKDT